MRELAILTFVSLDGVMESPMVPDEDLPGRFTEGGWANPCWDNVMESVGEVAMSQPYDVLLGRTTYDEFAPFFSGCRAQKLYRCCLAASPWRISIHAAAGVWNSSDKAWASTCRADSRKNPGLWAWVALYLLWEFWVTQLSAVIASY